MPQFISLIWLSIFTGALSFLLVPEELPSILSIFYSNVPPIKKGTDSRIGLGFRIGPNADFQVQFELGPQTNTQQIGPTAGSPNPPSKKRQTAAAAAAAAAADSDVNQKKRNFTNPSEKWINTWQLNLDKAEETADNEVVDAPRPHYSLDPTKERNNLVIHLRQLYEQTNKTSDVD